MIIKDLKEKLIALEVPKFEYSLDGELIPDAIHILRNYGKWEVFYLDERGTRNDEKVFKSESDACTHVYNLFKEAKEIKEKFNKKE